MTEPGLRPLLARRLGRGQLIALDGAFGVILTVLAVMMAPTPPGWLVWLLAVSLGLPIAVRRLWPLPALAVALAALLAAVSLQVELMWAPYVAPACVLYVVALVAPRSWSVAALVITWFGMAAAIMIARSMVVAPPVVEAPFGVDRIAASWLAAGAVWTVARAVRARREYAVLAVEQGARQALTDERLRIARELHDIVAHSLSLIAVKAGVANHVAQARPDEAQDALRIIEATSRDTLVEMRQLLGVLRSEKDSPETGPAPGLAGLPELADRAGMAGVKVDLDVRGEADLPEGVALSVYRIVQEALTNVAKHAAPASSRVVVEVRDREVQIEVTDDGTGGRQLPGGTGGHGLIGMRERVMMYGGTFSAGPRPGAGFGVSATVPYAPTTGETL